MFTIAEMRDQMRELLRQTPIGQQLDAQDHERIQAERRAVAARLADAERQSEAAVPAAAARLEAADVAFAKARAAFDVAQLQRQQAHAALAGASFAISHARANAERKLRETADPRIAEFIEWADAEWDATRRSIDRQVLSVSRNLVTDARTATVRTNFNFVVARTAALRGARKEAERLMLAVDIDIEAELARIRASVPELKDEVVQGAAA
jgi:hypothetical protein